MKKPFSNKYFNIILLTLTSYGIYLYACGGDGFFSTMEERSVFSPEITVNNANYKPFFYDPENKFYQEYYYDNTYEYKKSQGYFDKIVNQWYEYLEGNVKKEQLEYYLFDDDAKYQINQWGKNKKLTSNTSLNTKDKKIRKFLDFLVLAKQVEQFSNNPNDNVWDYEGTSRVLANAKFVKKVKKEYEQTDKKDEFYANRIWFQVLRTLFYSEDNLQIVSYFTETSESQPKNDLYYQGLDYVAGAVKKDKKYIAANCYYVRLFNEYTPMMKSALNAYRPVSNDTLQMIERVLTAQEKEALWAMQGYYTDAFEFMSKIYQINPKSKHLDFLLSRYVNILETKVNVYNNYWEENKMGSRKEYLKEVQSKLNTNELNWVFEVTNQNLITNKYLWNAASGYLQLLKGDFATVSSYLNKAKIEAKNEEQINQLRLLGLMRDLSDMQKIDVKTENKILKDLQWLKAKAKQTYEDTQTASTLRVSYLEAWVNKYLSTLYQEQKDFLKAELLYPESGFYKNEENMKAMEQFLLKKNKSSWEAFLEKEYPFSLEDIYECRGIYLFYQNKIDLAIQEFEKHKQIKVSKGDYKPYPLFGNPFNGKIKDCNDCDHQAYQRIKYTKIDFLYKVKEMQDKISRGEDVYNNALLVANAFYNASYFGNARYFYNNPIVGEYGNHISANNREIFHSMDNAKKYYIIAKNAALDKEQKAKITYMLAKLERNEYYNKAYFFKKDGYYGYSDQVIRPWKGFKELKDEYSDTKYYQEVINECGYFRIYLGIK
ncbi:MAG: hypothetical protein Q4B43_08045 [Bacteroidota bacterium]|nr:hypothetical protein [Bacteroidota bacterium]